MLGKFISVMTFVVFSIFRSEAKAAEPYSACEASIHVITEIGAKPELAVKIEDEVKAIENPKDEVQLPEDNEILVFTRDEVNFMHLRRSDIFSASVFFKTILSFYEEMTTALGRLDQNNAQLPKKIKKLNTAVVEGLSMTDLVNVMSTKSWSRPIHLIYYKSQLLNLAPFVFRIFHTNRGWDRSLDAVELKVIEQHPTLLPNSPIGIYQTDLFKFSLYFVDHFLGTPSFKPQESLTPFIKLYLARQLFTIWSHGKNDNFAPTKQRVSKYFGSINIKAQGELTTALVKYLNNHLNIWGSDLKIDELRRKLTDVDSFRSFIKQKGNSNLVESVLVMVTDLAIEKHIVGLSSSLLVSPEINLNPEKDTFAEFTDGLIGIMNRLSSPAVEIQRNLISVAKDSALDSRDQLAFKIFFESIEPWIKMNRRDFMGEIYATESYIKRSEDDAAEHMNAKLMQLQNELNNFIRDHSRKSSSENLVSNIVLPQNFNLPMATPAPTRSISIPSESKLKRREEKKLRKKSGSPQADSEHLEPTSKGNTSESTYQVILSHRFIKQVNKLDTPVKKIIEGLGLETLLSRNPKNEGKRRSAYSDTTYFFSINLVGKPYLIKYVIDSKTQQVHVESLGRTDEF